ncbi:MAG TPA: hypothetical protein VM659_27985 [Dongiaceae bacterium]|nr:hypothetical protein [Dongiaceae bacterium]
MKHDVLHAIVHNFADSLASGLGFVIGYYESDVFGEARRTGQGSLTVDFLSGRISGGNPEDSLVKAIMGYHDAFPDFCQKHGASVADFREATVRYTSDVLGNRFAVTIEDARGRRSSIEYVGVPGRRPKVLDDLNRVRPKPSDHT